MQRIVLVFFRLPPVKGVKVFMNLFSRFPISTQHCIIAVASCLAFTTCPAQTQSAQAQSTQAQVNVLTQRNDNARSGCNLQEAALNVSNVNAKSFGKLFSREVDGEIYAQPLIVSRLQMPGEGVRNVVFVATQHNSVYAFDADDPDAARPFWHVQLGPPVPVADVGQACGTYRDFSKEIGITGTPVIDAATQTLYVVARTKAPEGTFHQHLHALDLLTGKARPNTPLEIKATVAGKGRGSKDGKLAFEPLIHNQRPALLLHDGVVYISWAAHCDTGPYHGWIIGYHAKTLKQTTAFCTTPNGEGAGIWQSGTGPVVDEKGNIYIINGNGSVDTDKPASQKTEYGSSFLKLQVKEGQLSVADWFTPYNYTSLNEADLDTGSTSPVLVPGSNLLIAGSKAGMLYVLNKQKLGGFDMFSDQQIVQKFPASKGFMYSTPLVWQRAGSNPWLYSWGMDDRLKAFEVGVGQLNPTPVSQSAATITSPRPGGFLALSANGGDARSGILWALQPRADANHNVVSGVLRAFNASDLSQELWNSNQNASRDEVGQYAKFNTPTIANGKVYVPSFSNQLHVYGLNPPPQAPPPTLLSLSATPEDFVTIDTDLPRARIHYTVDGSEPTVFSPRYLTPFKPEQFGYIKARVFARGFAPSPVATLRIIEKGIPGTGNGLAGSYFTQVDLRGTEIKRIDAQINNNPRPKELPRENWSARWTGYIQAMHTGEHTIYTRSDDGIRVWIDGQKIIDHWIPKSATEDKGTVTLQAGQKYPIRIEYFQDKAEVVYELMWATPYQEKQLIPQSQLYAEATNQE
jgi:hypothetical protein